MPTYAVGQRLTAALLQELADLIEDSTVSASVTSDVTGVTTTETVAVTLVAYLESGSTYQLDSFCRIGSSVAADAAIHRIRLTNTSGTVIQAGQTGIPTTSGVGFNAILHGEYTASATGNQTFVLTFLRNSGSGTLFVDASATEPAWLTCRLKSGA